MDKKIATLVQGSLDKAREKLRVAQSLLKNGDHEDAVSRAYYAAFHAAQAVLLTEGLTANTHQGLVNLFGLHFVKAGRLHRKLGKYLSNLKDDRENGDYEIYSAIDEETAVKAVTEAKDFVAAIREYLDRLPR